MFHFHLCRRSERNQNTINNGFPLAERLATTSPTTAAVVKKGNLSNPLPSSSLNSIEIKSQEAIARFDCYYFRLVPLILVEPEKKSNHRETSVARVVCPIEQTTQSVPRRGKPS